MTTPQEDLNYIKILQDIKSKSAGGGKPEKLLDEALNSDTYYIPKGAIQKNATGTSQEMEGIKITEGIREKLRADLAEMRDNNVEIGDLVILRKNRLDRKIIDSEIMNQLTIISQNLAAENKELRQENGLLTETLDCTEYVIADQEEIIKEQNQLIKNQEKGLDAANKALDESSNILKKTSEILRDANKKAGEIIKKSKTPSEIQDPFYPFSGIPPINKNARAVSPKT